MVYSGGAMGTLGLRVQTVVDRVVTRVSGVPDAQLSAISPPSGEGDAELLDLALRSASATLRTAPGGLAGRHMSADQRRWAELWPGEHYRLLPTLASEIGAHRVVEVGTFTGMGAIALRDAGPEVVTYDITPWRQVPGSILEEGDFGPGRLEQRIGDLAAPAYFSSQLGTLRGAQLIFVDGPKDRVFEPAFWSLLAPAMAGSGAVVLFDDIRVANMVSFWHSVGLPKLDITSVGHWSGSGLVRL